MKYSAKTKPGMGDPYWYEWSVGQQYIIDMLNSDNNIKCVELQANVKFLEIICNDLLLYAVNPVTIGICNL